MLLCGYFKDSNAHLVSVDGRESECMPVWSEEGTPMPPAIWFIWLVPDEDNVTHEGLGKNSLKKTDLLYFITRMILWKWQWISSVVYLMGSYSAVAGAGRPVHFAEWGSAPGPEKGTGSHMAGQGQRRPSAWSLGQCVWHCWWLWHSAGRALLYWWHSAGQRQGSLTWLKKEKINKWLENICKQHWIVLAQHLNLKHHIYLTYAVHLADKQTSKKH